MQKKRGLIVLAVLVLMIAGCASTGRLIDNASFQTRVVMTDAVFLSLTPKEKTAYIRVTNTSDLQGVMLAPVLKDRLIKKGFTLLNEPANASYIQPNITSFVPRKEGSASKDVSIAGTIMGGVTGAALASGRGDALSFAIAGSIVGNVGGAVLGSLFKVQSVAGTVDLQIQEKTDTLVAGVMRTDARQGTSTVLSTQQAVQSMYQTHRTRFEVEARRTNLNIDEAVAGITDKLADQIAGLF